MLDPAPSQTSQTSQTSGASGAFARALSAYVAFSRRRRWWIVGACLVLAAVSAALSLRIKLDPNLESLLPRDTETIRAMREANRRYGSTDLFTIVMVLHDPDSVARLQDEVAGTLRRDWPDAVYVQTERSNDFFVKHALVYLPTHYLRQILDKLDRVQEGLGTRTPFGVDLLDDAPAAPAGADTGAWFDASIPQQLGLPDEAASAFSKFLSKPADPAARADGDYDPKAAIPDSLKPRLIGKMPDGRVVGLVQAALKYPSSNIDYVKTVLARTRVLLAPYRARYGARLQIGVEGPYKEFEEVDSLSKNGILATAISLGLNFLIIFAYFRGLAPVLVITALAVLACLMTLAGTALVYGHLNLYTVFVISIIFGMGIDYSIYALGTAQRLAGDGDGWEGALSGTLRSLASSLLVAAATTIAGLLTLLVSKFVGFYEFGVIASGGILISFALTFLALPACVFACLDLRRLAPRLLDLHPYRLRRLERAAPPRRDWETVARRGAAAVALITVFLACFIPRVGFETDFSRLRDTRGHGAKLPVGVALGTGRVSSQPVVALARDSAAMAALHDTLLHRLTVEKDPYLRSFLTLSTFVPPDTAQAARLVLIRRIGEIAGMRVFDRAHGQDSDMIARLRSLASTAGAFGPGDIPAWALNLLRERDGSYGKLGFIYGNYNSSDALDAARFQARYGNLEANGERLAAFSSSFIFSDIVRIVKGDSGKMALCMAAALVLLLSLILRNRRLLALCAIEMAVGAVWNLGLLGLFHLKINVFNLIVVSTLQGYMVDVVAYLLLAYLRGGRARLGELYTGIGVLVSVSTLTTTSGYAGMLFTTHQGIASIGEFAVLGLPALLISSLGLTPWLCLKLIPDSMVETGAT